MNSFNPRAIQEEYYGDVFRWWIGVVVNNNDPLQAGRLRVRIFGVHNEDTSLVPEEALPWAFPIIPTTEDGVSGLGRACKIKPGAMVTGYFADGPQSQIPIVLGSIPRFAGATPGQLGEGNRFPTSSVKSTENSPRQKVKGLEPPTITPQSIPTDGAVGANNTEKSFNFLITSGFTPFHAAAVLGCMLQDTKLDPTYKRPDQADTAYGICAWQDSLGRVDRLKDFCYERGLVWTTLDAQLQFFVHEYTITDARIFRYTEFTQSNKFFIACKLFATFYMRVTPDDYARESGQRTKLSKQIFDSYNRA
jgi:hypothetical protein